jgi:hypothetical protein
MLGYVLIQGKVIFVSIFQIIKTQFFNYGGLVTIIFEMIPLFCFFIACYPKLTEASLIGRSSDFA